MFAWSRKRWLGGVAAVATGVALAVLVAGAAATGEVNVFAGQWTTNTGSIEYAVADPSVGAAQLIGEGGQPCAPPTVYYVGTYSDPGPRTGVASGCTVGGPNHLVGRFVGDASTDRGSAGDININFVAPSSFSGYSTNVNSPGGSGQQFSYTGTFRAHFAGDGCCPAPPPTAPTTTTPTTTTAPAAGDVFNLSVLPLFPIIGLESAGKLADFQSSFGSGTYSATIYWGDGTAPAAGQVYAPVAQGSVFSRAVSGTHTYDRNGTYTVAVTITDPGGHAHTASNTATVTACFCTTRPPVLGKTVDVGPVSGSVFIKLPAAAARAGAAHAAKGSSFVPLTEAREIPVGSQIDARQGKLVVMTATTTAGQLGAGAFSGGIFQLLQRRSEVGLTDLRLGSAAAARICKSTGKARTAAARKLSKRVLALLHASVSGQFRTTGRFSAATVRGTEWTTTDRCDGTLTSVARGSVTVYNFRAKRNIVVPAGHSYLAKAR